MIAAKHIGLESFRVRTCDPGPDDRLPIDRASCCWNDDPRLDCHRQSAGLPAPGWLSAFMPDSARRWPSVDRVETQMGLDFQIANTILIRVQGSCVSARHRLTSWLSSTSQANSGTTSTHCAVHPRKSVFPSGRNAPFFVLSKPFLSGSFPGEISQIDDGRQAGVRRATSSFPATTDSQYGLRTHSLTRVSDEKRNVDECPPTGGKSDCHR